MKKIFGMVMLIILCLTTSSFAGNGKTTLSGRITDKSTGQTIPGASIYIPDLKTGAVSGIDGNYLISDLPSTTVVVQVSEVGYKTILKKIDLEISTTADFAMEPSINEISEVVVTAQSAASERNRTPTPVAIVSKTQLLQNASSNIIDALATQPGISQITTGSGISKPVIRGLGYNRVVVVNDGVRQEGQQWGDEHGIEIDEYGVNRVEIMKGPASLSYGSDAIAGVVNMLPAQPLPAGTIEGSLTTNYQTNNGLIGYSGDIAGNYKGFIWDLRYSNKMAHSYQNRYDGFVYNSGYRENNIGGVLGLNKAWGYSHLHFSAYSLEPGLVEGIRDSLTGKFIKDVPENDSVLTTAIAGSRDFHSYTPGIPYQKVNHYKAVLNNSFVAGRGSIKFIAGFQQNQRKEFGDAFHPDSYGLYFLLNTINYDLRYAMPEKNGFDLSVGINGMQQSSQNKGTEFLVPDYQLFDIGGFVIVKKTYKKFDVSGGIRYDTRTEHTDALFLNAEGLAVSPTISGAAVKFAGSSTMYSGISGSAGITCSLTDKLLVKFNAARGYRAPSIGEIAANGIHEGTLRYEMGNILLKAENSTQFDLGVALNTEHISAEADLFNNDIQNFIFLRKLNSTSGSDSIREGATAFQYVSGHATLRGGEISIDIHPHPFDWLHFENSFSYVQASQQGQPDSTRYLPFTPSPKLISELRANIRKPGKYFANLYVKAGVENYFAQNHYYSAYRTETATPAYTLLNAGFGTDLTLNKKTLCSIYISANNITDVAYQSHLSRLKYADVNNVTGRTGVYNMGRNISFKVIIPVGIKSK